MRFLPTLWATVLTLAALAILIALGVWQLERRAWKHRVRRTHCAHGRWACACVHVHGRLDRP